MSITDILLIVSVGCNLWFLFLLLYDRIMETKMFRFFKGIARLWRSLESKGTKNGMAQEEVTEEETDIIGKSRFRMASARTTAATPVPQAATSEKGIGLSEEDTTFDDGKTETASRPAQVPEEKLDETFTSIPPEELGYGEEEPEEDASDTPRASGNSFDEIDDACKTAKNPNATQAEREKAAKVFTDMEGTELYEKMMEGSSEIGIRIRGLIEIRLKKPKKVFVMPDNIEEFDIRNYV
ncbi:conjugal transfer protein TraD [Bacteroides nordii]|uniref:conjugal transfer protein TraD n=1 Tax=Bacteroides TaxID=816 RepID=UPI001F24097E|nr:MULTISPECIES: conjugal transfer protein TraD [Bacteroides]MCE8464478.1 conjugal transfer protein TraD [Bacteroides nordii]UYU49845.1 conjugal transfer protein TraD [Bacteroides nordii]